MLLPIPPIRRRRRVRRLDPAMPPVPTVDVVRVAVVDGTEFDWTIRWEFSDDVPTDLTLADFSGLHVDSGEPTAVEDADANWVVLRYHTDQGPGAGWLVAPGGNPIFVPGQSGTVNGP